MEDLFQAGKVLNDSNKREFDARQNLAFRMRPQTLDSFIGQRHILSPGKLLHRLIETDCVSALLLHGPPGTGKTSLAHVIANISMSRFIQLNAVEATVADLRKAVEGAEYLWRQKEIRSLLLIDEIHRFNKAQQDAILPHLEKGTIQLIGATTQNPYFSVNSALLSRMQVFEFKCLGTEEILQLLNQALEDKEHGFGTKKVQADPEALDHLATLCEGDGRRALNALEIGIRSSSPENGNIRFTLESAIESLQKKAPLYDRDGDQHYDTVSAFIKSIRGSEPDAAIYLLAKMLESGEDIRFIARRLVISASEDIGMADPHALPLAIACQQAVDFLGLPEARIPLAHTTVYLATAPKSNTSYVALNQAAKDLREGKTREIPASLKDTSYSGAKNNGHGDGYQYAHDYKEGVSPEIQFPVGSYYRPTQHGYEKIVAERLERWRQHRTKINQPTQ
ncbi:MAG: replication-associated recombination protein A [Verrucomicrobiota bacterium]